MRKVLVRLVSVTWRHSASVYSMSGLRMFVPALLIRMSTLPKAATTSFSSRRTSSSTETSA